MKNRRTMYLFLFTALLFQLGTSADVADTESLLDMDELEFEEFFGLPHVTDPEEFAKRQNALKANEEEIRKTNKEFAEGKKTWYDNLNDFSDLSKEEFLEQKTGLIDDDGSEGTSHESMRYFARMKRSTVPDQYDAVAEGLVTPARNQGGCGSCTAFATMSSVETCFKKASGEFGDYSEQQLVDCAYRAYDGYGPFGCKGAWIDSYLRWIVDNKIRLASEDQYPYKSVREECPIESPEVLQETVINDYYFTTQGDEELLKKLVYEHGAVVTTVHVNWAFQNYGGGVLAPCEDDSWQNHAVSVVGYGTENGVDYWLIKNSWGTWWGDKGFMKLKRGVDMCRVGRRIAVAKCGASHLNCTDIRERHNCEYWKGRGWCDGGRFQNYVQSHCQRTCGINC